ncbi:hypothetical protein B566_EDAN011616 [Ephemera danica]|nr:hypothetical protein B566_EDAN011616 [Ephemera danica]
MHTFGRASSTSDMMAASPYCLYTAAFMRIRSASALPTASMAFCGQTDGGGKFAFLTLHLLLFHLDLLASLHNLDLNLLVSDTLSNLGRLQLHGHLDLLDGLAEELLGCCLQKLVRLHDLALRHARHRQRHTLRCLHVLAHRVQRHHLDTHHFVKFDFILTSSERRCTSVTSHHAHAQPPTMVDFLVEPQQPPANTQRSRGHLLFIISTRIN